MKKTTFAAFGAFALLAVSAPAVAEDAAAQDIITQTGYGIVPAPVIEEAAAPAKMSLWEQLTGKGKAPAVQKNAVASPVFAAPAAQPAFPSQGALIEFAGVPTSVVIEIRENKAQAVAAQTQDVQLKAQEIAAAAEVAVDEAVEDAVFDVIAAHEEAPAVAHPKKMSLWAQLTGKDKKAAGIEAAEAYVAPAAETAAKMEAQAAVAQETAIPLWERLAVEKPATR